MVSEVTQADVRELLDYDPETGVFTWRDHRSSRVRAGDVAGHVGRNGYRRIKIGGVHYLAHRLAWLYMTGGWPPEEVDHRNGCKDDNRFDNLRCASSSQNKWNKGANITNPLGLRGVTHVKRGLSKPYRAVIKVGEQSRHLGYFETAEEAHEAYLAEAIRHHGDFVKVSP